mmetsp:Transcript_92967/g.268476  ORF Transcript_92967/g.268476 Transcript_92967/m.268476 type:complete len:310 (+) Transcript_92967:237-1166(+)
MLPGCVAVWQSDLSLHTFPKELGSAISAWRVATAAASASAALRAAPSLRAAGSATLSCWCLKSTCLKKTDPACAPVAATFCRFAAGPDAVAGSFGLLLASKAMQTAPTEGTEKSASVHHRKAAAFGCLANPFAKSASRWDGRPAVAPASSASRQLRVVVSCQDALSGSMRTIDVGKRNSLTPIARLVLTPIFSNASCRGKASEEHGRRIVSTASSHMAFANVYSALAAATPSNFSSRLICRLHAFSASSATDSVSQAAALSTPSSSAAPSRVWMSAWSTFHNSLQAAASAPKIVSAASFAASSRAKALL